MDSPFTKALPLLEQSHAEFQELNDPYWQLISYDCISFILVQKDKLKPSERRMQVLELARKGEDRLNLADALFEYSMWLYHNNRLGEAIKYAEEADALYKQLGSIFNSNYLFAQLAWLNGNYKKAESYYMGMQERLGLIGEKNQRSDVTIRLGLLAMEQGNIEQAQSYTEEALATSREIDNNFLIAGCLAQLGNTFYLQGNIERLRHYFRECISVAKPLSIYLKRYILLLLLNYMDIQKLESTVYVLGALDISQRDGEDQIDPLFMRYYNHAEAHTHEKLGESAFESAFAKGRKMSLDDALDLVLQIVEEME